MPISLETDEPLVRYLLGNLPDDEAQELERAYFADDRLFERLLAVDTELTDAYVRDELDPESRAMFEKRASASAPRLEKVEFARALRARASEESRSSAARRTGASISPFRILGIASALTAAAAVLLLLSAVWLFRRATQLQHQLVEESTRQTAIERRIAEIERRSADQQAQLADLSAGSRSETGQAPALRRPEPLPEIRVASFLLVAGLVRDPSGGNQIAVPADAELVRLNLALEGNGYRQYRAVLAQAGGGVIWSREGLKPRSVKGGEFVIITVSARLLPPGDYVVTLQGKATSVWEDAEYFTFRAVRR